MNPHYEKACLLAEQGRYSLAEKEALAALAEEPNSDRAYNILSHCQGNQQRYDEALVSVQQAIALAPDDAFHYYRLASIHKMSGQFALAQTAVTTSLKLDPDAAETYGMAASIYHHQDNLDQMLAFADKGLALNPEHQTCWNMRVLALLISGQMQTAETEVVRLLELYPDEAFSHAARGWVAIYRGKPAHSLEAFKTALQINPNSEWARAGLMEAIKAQNVLYRQMLRYSLWQSRFRQQKPGVFWALWLMLPPVRSLYALLVIFSWVLNYFCDVALRFHPYGSLLFTAKEKALNNVTVVIIGLFLGGAWLGLATQRDLFFLVGCLLGLTSYLACLSWTAESRTQQRMIGAAAGLCAVATLLFAGALLPFFNPTILRSMGTSVMSFLIGAVILLWIGRCLNPLWLGLQRKLKRPRA